MGRKVAEFVIYTAIYFILHPSVTHAVTFRGSEGLAELVTGSHTADTHVTIMHTDLILVDENITSLIPAAQHLTINENGNLESFSTDAFDAFDGLTHLYIGRCKVNAVPNLNPVKSTLTHLTIKECPLSAIDDEAFVELKSLVHLSIQKCPLIHFPELASNTALSELLLDVTQIDTVREPALPASVTTFQMTKNTVDMMPSSNLFSVMTNLTTLKLESNKLALHLNEVLSGCQKLEYLDVSNNGVAEFPDFGACSDTIQTVLMDGNNITWLSDESVINMTSLKVLKLSKNQLTIFPPAIGELPGLSELWMAENNFSTTLEITSPNHFTLVAHKSLISTFPDISEAPNLREIYLSSNQIRHINMTAFTDNSSLSKIDLGANQLTTFPPVSPLKHLLSLYLHQNQIDRISWSDANPMNLELDEVPWTELKLSDNRNLNVTDLTIWSKMKNLQNLDMNRCGLIGIPYFLTGLGNLRNLNMQSNALEELPDSVLSTLHQLSYVNLVDNNIRSISSLALKQIDTLRHIRLSNNKLNTLGSIFNPVRPVISVELRGNELTCDWALCWIKTDTQSTFNLDELPCANPESLRNSTWESIPTADLDCGRK